MAGRKLAIAGGPDEPFHTDGETIYVPSGGDDAELRGALVVQAALLAVGSLEPQLVARLIGRPRSSRRYLTLETARAMNHLRDSVPAGVAELVCRHWDGRPSGSAQESLTRALAGAKDIPEAPVWFGTIRPAKILRKGGLGRGTLPTEREQQQLPNQAPMSELSDDDDAEEVAFFKLLSSPFGRRMPRWLQDLLGMEQASSPGEEGSGAELPVGGATQVERVGRHAKPAATAPARREQVSRLAPRGRRYPEWDWRTRSYRPNWCSVFEYDPRPQEVVPGIAPGADLPLRRELARLGLAYERHRRQPDGEDLDLNALIDYHIDMATGGAGDDRVYEAQLRTARDLGVVVLLDATGSTGESAEGQLIFEEQRRLVAHLTAVLDDLGDRVAAFAFRSNGRENVQFLRIKEFDDRFDHAAQRRMAGLEPSGFTRLGAAIRHAVQLAETKAGTSNLLLVVVADGLPYDPDRYEGTYAQRDTRRALDEAVARGVGCACVSVRSGTDEAALERVWGNVPHSRLTDATQLARDVRPLFRAALRAAASSPRRTGRPRALAA